MKVSFFYIALMIGSQQLLQAHTAFAQGLDKRVTIGAENETLTDVFRKLKTQTNLSFVFPAIDSDEHSGITFKTEDRTVREVLDLALRGSRLTYTFKDNMVIIHDKPGEEAEDQNTIKENAVEKSDSPFFTITGTVKDASTQAPLPGVNVIVKGTMRGTTTDVDGRFMIDAENSEMLVFSFIGFKTFEMPVVGRSAIDVTMEGEAKALQEVVVSTLYYDVKDREKTGNISKISANVIGNQPVTNPLQTMQGRMPGVYITQDSGVPGSNLKVQIRGMNSLTSGNQPLYIIDGVQFVPQLKNNDGGIIGQELYGASWDRGQSLLNGTSALNSINPNDIESIEVLKDGDATAIYGSRGANGVILITTKRGKSGGVKVDVNLKTGVSKLIRKERILNTKEYITMRKEAVANDGDAVPGAYEYDINGTWDQSRYTDWQDVLIGGVAPMTDVTSSVSGGNNETRFLFSVGYNDQGTVYPGDNKARRFSTHFSISNTSPNEKFVSNFSTSYSLTKSNLISRDLTIAALNLAPNAPSLYDERGKLNWENSTWQNPLAYLFERFEDKGNNLLTSAEFRYEIVKGLRIKSSFGLNDFRNAQQQTRPSTATRPIENKTAENYSYLWMASSATRSWIVEPQVDWNTKVSKGKLSMLFGGTYQYRVSELTSQKFRGFSTNALLGDPNSASIKEEYSYGYSEYKYAALYARLNYIWDEKYIMNITGRRDGSSRFGPGRKFANFGALGLAWIFSNEPFMTDLPFLSFGKIRGSYGWTGNDQIGDYSYLDIYNSISQYQGIGTLGPGRLFNPDFGWEVNKKLEGALELGFLDDRILFTTAYYRNRSSSQLINYQLAATTGFAGVLQNSPAIVQNTGLELELNTINIIKGDWKWTASANISFPRNKLIVFPGLASSSYAKTYTIGRSLNTERVFHYLGVDPSTGLYQMRDVNNDGNLTPDDQTVVLEYKQHFYGGINNSISWKGLQLDIFFQFVSQSGRISNANGLVGSFDYNFGYGNSSLYPLGLNLFDNRWRQTGDNAAIQKFSRVEYSSTNIFFSDGLAGNWYYVRLKNISISYPLPDKILRGLKSRVYLQGQNLLTLTDYPGLDPESGDGKLPPLATLVGGIQLTF